MVSVADDGFGAREIIRRRTRLGERERVKARRGISSNPVDWGGGE